eukprot:gene19500-25391_t
MVDPVIDREGNTYERKQIVEWIKLHNSSPITRNPLTVTDLAPNRALKTAIEEALIQINSVTKTNSIVLEKNDNQSQLISLTLFKEVNPLSGGDSNNPKTCNVNVSILHEETSKRIPSDIIVVIDVSGSMGANVSVPRLEDCSLTILDIVKHAVRTIISTLDENDRLSIVKFSNSAVKLFELTTMNEIGKVKAELMLNNLHPGGMTNLWDALLTSMNTLNEHKSNSNPFKNSSIMILTDGEPNVNPPRGIIPMLERFKESNGGKLPGTINTFGFGYTLDSKLLYDIATMAGGMYSFIPDSGFVGTAFVNALANTLVTVVDDALLEITPSPSVKVLTNRVIHLGNIQAGQSKDIVTKLSIPAGYEGIVFHASLTYYHWDTINKCKIIRSIESDCSITFSDSSDEILNSMIVASQRFHPGIQYYGGISFCSVRDIADDMFCKLPSPIATNYLSSLPPSPKSGNNSPKQIDSSSFPKDNFLAKPSSIMQLTSGLSAISLSSQSTSPKSLKFSPTSLSPSSTIQMAFFNNKNAPCFHESCLIYLIDGTTKQLPLVKRGDVLLNDSVVECVLRTKCFNSSYDFVDLNDSTLLVTPWHPVYQDNDWRFPYDITNGLVKSHKFINGVKCLALAHGISNHPVASHPFFGSLNIVRSLMKCKGWESGMVTLDQNQGPCVQRDFNTGLICDIFECETILQQ